MSALHPRSPAVSFLAVAGLALALAAAPAPLAAQDQPPQMILVHTEIVNPWMLDEYVESSKAFGAYVQAHRDTMPTFNAQAFQTDEYEFLFAMPLESFGQLDSLMGEFMATMAAGGEEWEKLMAAGAGTTRHSDESIVMFRTDLSYQPAEPRVPPGEATAFRWDYYYLRPEMASEAEQIAKDVAALYAEKGIKDAFAVFQGVLGADLPYFVVSIPGKSPADIASRLSEVEATIGEAWAPIQARIDAATRAFASKHAWARSDLSVAPPAPADGE